MDWVKLVQALAPIAESIVSLIAAHHADKTAAEQKALARGAVAAVAGQLGHPDANQVAHDLVK